MSRWIVAAGVSAIVGIALAACSGDGDSTSFGSGGPCPGKTPPAAQTDGEMSVEEFINLVTEAITCPGYALHVRSSGDNESGPYSYHLETKSWIDVRNNVGRSEFVYTALPDDAQAQAQLATAEAEGVDYELETKIVTIVDGEGSYSKQGDQPAEKGRIANCYDHGREALELLIPCHNGPLQDIALSIDTEAEYQGASAIGYVGNGTSRGEDETYEMVSTTFMDSETFLPIGETHVGTLDIGEIYPVNADLLDETEFVPLDSLPDDFFDPTSIGYVEPDPYDVEAPLDDSQVPVYWLGREFAGEGEFPALAVRYAFVRPEAQSGPGGYLAEIVYRAADDEFGRYFARIDLFTPAGWEERQRMMAPQELPPICEDTVEFEVPGGHATVFRGHRGAAQGPTDECLPPDEFSAVVQFDDVVVDIDAPATGNGREIFYSPYDSEEGIKLLARSLKLRE